MKTKNITPNLVLLLLSCSFVFTTNAQIKVWEYEVKGETKTKAHIINSDEKGDLYINLNFHGPTKSSDKQIGSNLLHLNSDGKFKGTSFITNHGIFSQFIPFKEGQLLVYRPVGHFEDRDKSFIQLFDLNGNLLKQEDHTDKKNRLTQGHYQSNDSLTFAYISPIGEYRSTQTICIGSFNQSLLITYDSIEIGAYHEKFKSLGLSLNPDLHNSRRLENGSWVMEMSYGRFSKIKRGAYNFRTYFSTLLGVKKNKIIWEYPKDSRRLWIRETKTYRNNTALIYKLDHRVGNNYFLLLDEYGKPIIDVKIDPSIKRIIDLLPEEDHFYVNNNDYIFKIDFQGNILSKYSFENDKLKWVGSMHRSKDGSLICVGNRNNNAVFMKIDFEKNELDVLEQEDHNDRISYMSINEEDLYLQNIFAYPNPTTGLIKIKWSRNIEGNNFNILLISSLGEIIVNEVFQGFQYNLDLSGYSPGTYYYQIKSDSNNLKGIASGKIVLID